MTNDEREALIEEAATAIAEFASYEGPRDAYHLAKVLYGRFEQAHTPTDDEREAEHRPVQAEPGWHDGTIPLYGMLDVWMALYGTSHPGFDEFYAEHGYAETWVRILAAVRRAASYTQSRLVHAEPTEAQLLAALNAYDPRAASDDDVADWGEEHVADMRAALRAALQEGESR